jgi:ketosteroid isomerase-like protein
MGLFPNALETNVMLRSSATLLALLLLSGAGCSRGEHDGWSDAEIAAANVLLVRRTVEEGYNGRNPEIFDAAYHPNAVVWNNGTRMVDGPVLEGFRRDLREYDQQFSEWRIDIEDIFGTADRVAVRWVFHGTLRDNGQRVSRTGNWIGRIQDGKVVEVWEAVDE